MADSEQKEEVVVEEIKAEEPKTAVLDQQPVLRPMTPDPAPVPPKKEPRRLIRNFFYGAFRVVIAAVTLPIRVIRKKGTADTITVVSVDQGFFLWALMVAGWGLAAIVRHDVGHAGWAGWSYAWLVIVFLASIIYDLNAKKMFWWAVVFFAIWMSLKYAQDVKHWVVLGAITTHLSNLAPKLDPGFASFIAWVLLIPFVYSVFHMFAYGRKRFTPNEICEYHLFEGDELSDRQGIKFKTKYRDLLETVLSFGGGDIIALDNHGNEFKRYPNILGLWFVWPKLERIIEQRAVVEEAT